MSLPSYIKELEGAARDPGKYVIGSMSTLLSKSIDLAHNEDYFGNYVYGPAAPTGAKLKDIAKYMAPTPFSISNYQRAQQSAGRATAVLSLFGFPKAPSDLDFTPAERKAVALLKVRQPRHTPEELADWQKKREALESGELSPKEARAYLKEQRLSFLEREVKQLTYGEALQVLDEANDVEQMMIHPIIQKKRQNLLKAHKQAQIEKAEEAAQ